MSDTAANELVGEQSGGQHADSALHALLDRISHIVGDPHVVKPAATATPAPRPLRPGTPATPPAARPAPVDHTPITDAFVPLEPMNLREARLTEGELEALLIKCLFSRGSATGRELAEQVKLPFNIVDASLRQLKQDQLIYYRGTAVMNDYDYQISDMGRERARRLLDQSTYFGSAPVHLKDYLASFNKQTLTDQHPGPEDLKRAFADLLLSPQMMNRLGPAINSGRGLFLYGAPGNGKTSIAERVTGCFGNTIWIPRALGIDGEIIRLFDPTCHEEAPHEAGQGLLDNQKIDKRWIRIRRPTIIVGGELTMDSLEVTRNTATGISEAPLQLKSNCGTLVIDDFGRQRVSTAELLNRWIVPLEKRYDFLNLPSGKKIQVPFDQLIIFSTNLQPRDLCDDAFLRRIPYKIDVIDPSEEDFKRLFSLMCPKLGFEYRDEPVEHLLEKHYRAVKRPMRCCQPRDLLMQVRNFCQFNGRTVEMTNEYFDFAVENYFAVV